MGCDVLVTGEQGFVGRHVVERARLAGLDVGVGIKDLLVQGEVARVIDSRRPRSVIHLAAPRRADDQWGHIANELRMAGLVLAAAARYVPSSPVLIVGSAAQYGVGRPGALRESDPTIPVTSYGAAKSVLEAAVTSPPLRGPVRVIFARSFNHIGPGQHGDAPAAQWAQQVLEAEAAGHRSIRTGDLGAVRDFLDVRDVADAYLSLVETDARGVFNVCSGRPVQVRRVAELLAQQSAVPLVLELDPRLKRDIDPPFVVGDPSRLKAITSWTPRVTLEESVADLMQWHRNVAATQDKPSSVTTAS